MAKSEEAKKEKADIIKVVGQNLRELRKESGLTQEKVASMVQVNASYYSALERSKKLMSVPMLLRLSKAFNTTTDAIIKITDTTMQIDNIALILNNYPPEIVNMIEMMIRGLVSETTGKE